MKRLDLCTVVGIALLATSSRGAVGEPAGQWQSLFNGKDLTGWQAIDGPADSWGAEDGLLFTTGAGGGWLSTTQQYANFELELEFRVPAGGNSGVFLRAPHQGNPAFAGLEIQVLDDDAPEYAQLKPTQYTGSVYDLAGAERGHTKPAGQWQSMRIVCQDRSVVVTLNGSEIVCANLDDYQNRHGDHPGLARRDGYLGLQNHGSRLEYRNLRIRELP